MDHTPYVLNITRAGYSIVCSCAGFGEHLAQEEHVLGKTDEAEWRRTDELLKRDNHGYALGPATYQCLNARHLQV